jgi:VanZ family protein
MILTRRHKFAIAALLLYWPAIFAATHLPIPKLVQRAGINDKMIHFLAYLILTLFIWIAVSPQKKVNWLKWPVWVTLAAAAFYGIMDEWLQGFVGRSTDIMDFRADMIGVIACLIILTFFSFWPALMIVSAVFLYILPNFSTGYLLIQNQMLNTAFYFIGFAGFTMIWVQVLEKFLPMHEINFKWPIVAMLIPLILLAALKLTTAILGKNVWPIDIITAIAGVLIIIVISWPTGIFRHKIAQRKQDNDAYKW